MPPFQPPASDRVVGEVAPAAAWTPQAADRVVGELTIEQQRALAKVRARMRMAAAQPGQRSGFEDVTETMARGMVRGIPVVGPTIEAGIEHVESWLTGEPLEKIQARRAQLQQQNPGLNMGAEIAGSVAGMAPMVAAAPTAFGVGAGGLAARVGLGAASGSVVGGLDVAARGGAWETGALFGAAGGGAGVLIGGALGRAFARRAATPTSQALKAQAGPLFERARAAGVVVKGDPYRATVAKLATALQKEGLDPVLHPKATRVLVRLQEATQAGQLDLGDLTTLRRLAGTAAGSIDADERRIGQIMVDQLDGFLGKLGSADVLAGDPAAVNATLREARQLWSRAAKAEIIEDALERAGRAQAGGTVTEGTALRGQFRRIANNAKLMRRFSPDERRAIKAVASEDQVAEALKLIGGLRGMVVGGAVGWSLGPVGSAGAAGALMMVGLAGRGMAARSARTAAQAAQELAATGRLAQAAPSVRGSAFGHAATLGAGLEVGREVAP